MTADKNAQERVLEYALDVLYREDAQTKDSSAAILAAWKERCEQKAAQAEQGAALSGEQKALDPVPPTGGVACEEANLQAVRRSLQAVRSRNVNGARVQAVEWGRSGSVPRSAAMESDCVAAGANSGTRFGRYAAAALLLILAGVGAFGALWPSAPAAPTLALAHPPVQLFGPAEPRSNLCAGDALTVPAGEEVQLNLVGGHLLDVFGPAVLSIERGGVRLASGRLNWNGTAASDSFSVRTAVGAIESSGAGEFECNLVAQVDSLAAPATAQDFEALCATPEQSLELSVVSSKAELVRGGSRLPFDAGQGCVAGIFRGEEVLLEREQVTRAVALAQNICPLENDLDSPFNKKFAFQSEEVQVQLLDLLNEQNPLWLMVEPVLRDDFLFTEVESHPGHVLGFLARSNDPSSLGLATKLWRDHRDKFLAWHVLAFAENGGAVFEQDLREAVLAWDGGHPGGRLNAATYFALRGDGVGESLLRTALGPHWFEEWAYEQVLAAATGLRQLGDPQHWIALGRLLELEVLHALSEGDLARARTLVLKASAFLQLQGEPGPLSLRELSFVSNRFVESRVMSLQEGREIEALLAEVLSDWNL